MSEFNKLLVKDETAEQDFTYTLARLDGFFIGFDRATKIRYELDKIRKELLGCTCGQED